MKELKRKIRSVGRLAGYDVTKITKPQSKESLRDSQIKNPIYHQGYSADSLNNRAFLNIGAGDFKHAYWRNLDFPTEAYMADVKDNMDIILDLSKLVPDSYRIWDYGGRLHQSYYRTYS